jgi:chemotaxis protein histidine kinase CheA
MALNATIDLTVKKPDFKSMKAEIRELTVAAQQAVMQFGEFSPEAVKAEQALAGARDRMDDFNDRVKAVNPDKFAQLNTVVSGVARGFQAAQGAMALFGNESEDLQKTMVKLQGAMALAEGLEGLGKVQQQFGAIAKNIKGGVTQAFQSLGRISTLALGGIGIVLTLVITNFDSLKKAVMSLIPGLGSMAKFVGGLVQQFTDWVGITSAQDRALAKLNKTTEKANEQLDREIALLKARGDEVGVFNKQRQKLENDLAQARANYGKNTEKEWGKIILDTKNALAVLRVEEQNFQNQQAQAQADANAQAEKDRQAERDKKKAEKKKEEEEAKAAEKLKNEQIAEANQGFIESERERRLAQAKTEQEAIKIKYQNERLALRDAFWQQLQDNAGNEEAIKLIKAKYQSDTATAKANFDKEEAEANKKASDEFIANKKKEGEVVNAIAADSATKRINSEKAVQQAKQDLFKASIDLANSIAALVGEQTKTGKAIALSVIAADTAMAISGALNVTQKPSPDNVATGGLAGAAKYIGLAAMILTNAKKARDILKGGQPSAPSGAGQMSGGGMPQMSAPRISSSLPTVGQFDTKVFVTEGDIRRTTDRVDTTRKVSVVK